MESGSSDVLTLSGQTQVIEYARAEMGQSETTSSNSSATGGILPKIHPTELHLLNSRIIGGILVRDDCANSSSQASRRRKDYFGKAIERRKGKHHVTFRDIVVGRSLVDEILFADLDVEVAESEPEPERLEVETRKRKKGSGKPKAACSCTIV